jgi:hypothetical protein
VAESCFGGERRWIDASLEEVASGVGCKVEGREVEGVGMWSQFRQV